jgi:hypothetical protein
MKVIIATVKELYDYIKLQIKLGKPVTPFHEAIVDAYEVENTRNFKEISSSNVVKKKLNNNTSWFVGHRTYTMALGSRILDRLKFKLFIIYLKIIRSNKVINLLEGLK